MKKIILLCSDGMSTSMMAKKMNSVATNIGYDCLVQAYALDRAKEIAADADCILIGPQVRFKLSQVKEDCPDVPADAIDMADYGMMNGEAVLKKARMMMGENV